MTYIRHKAVKDLNRKKTNYNTILTSLSSGLTTLTCPLFASTSKLSDPINPNDTLPPSGSYPSSV